MRFLTLVNFLRILTLNAGLVNSEDVPQSSLHRPHDDNMYDPGVSSIPDTDYWITSRSIGDFASFSTTALLPNLETAVQPQSIHEQSTLLQLPLTHENNVIDQAATEPEETSDLPLSDDSSIDVTSKLIDELRIDNSNLVDKPRSTTTDNPEEEVTRWSDNKSSSELILVEPIRETATRSLISENFDRNSETARTEIILSNDLPSGIVKMPSVINQDQSDARSSYQTSVFSKNKESTMTRDSVRRTNNESLTTMDDLYTNEEKNEIRNLLQLDQDASETRKSSLPITDYINKETWNSSANSVNFNQKPSANWLTILREIVSSRQKKLNCNDWTQNTMQKINVNRDIVHSVAPYSKSEVLWTYPYFPAWYLLQIIPMSLFPSEVPNVLTEYFVSENEPIKSIQSAARSTDSNARLLLSTKSNNLAYRIPFESTGIEDWIGKAYRKDPVVSLEDYINVDGRPYGEKSIRKCQVIVDNVRPVCQREKPICGFTRNSYGLVCRPGRISCKTASRKTGKTRLICKRIEVPITIPESDYRLPFYIIEHVDDDKRSKILPEAEKLPFRSMEREKELYVPLIEEGNEFEGPLEEIDRKVKYENEWTAKIHEPRIPETGKSIWASGIVPDNSNAMSVISEQVFKEAIRKAIEESPEILLPESTEELSSAVSVSEKPEPTIPTRKSCISEFGNEKCNSELKSIMESNNDYPFYDVPVRNDDHNKNTYVNYNRELNKNVPKATIWPDAESILTTRTNQKARLEHLVPTIVNTVARRTRNNNVIRDINNNVNLNARNNVNVNVEGENSAETGVESYFQPMNNEAGMIDSINAVNFNNDNNFNIHEKERTPIQSTNEANLKETDILTEPYTLPTFHSDPPTKPDIKNVQNMKFVATVDSQNRVESKINENIKELSTFTPKSTIVQPTVNTPIKTIVQDSRINMNPNVNAIIANHQETSNFQQQQQYLVPSLDQSERVRVVPAPITLPNETLSTTNQTNHRTNTNFNFINDHANQNTTLITDKFSTNMPQTVQIADFLSKILPILPQSSQPTNVNANHNINVNNDINENMPVHSGAIATEFLDKLEHYTTNELNPAPQKYIFPDTSVSISASAPAVSPVPLVYQVVNGNGNVDRIEEVSRVEPTKQAVKPVESQPVAVPKRTGTVHEGTDQVYDLSLNTNANVNVNEIRSRNELERVTDPRKTIFTSDVSNILSNVANQPGWNIRSQNERTDLNLDFNVEDSNVNGNGDYNYNANLNRPREILEMSNSPIIDPSIIHTSDSLRNVKRQDLVDDNNPAFYQPTRWSESLNDMHMYENRYANSNVPRNFNVNINHDANFNRNIDLNTQVPPRESIKVPFSIRPIHTQVSDPTSESVVNKKSHINVNHNSYLNIDDSSNLNEKNDAKAHTIRQQKPIGLSASAFEPTYKSVPAELTVSQNVNSNVNPISNLRIDHNGHLNENNNVAIQTVPQGAVRLPLPVPYNSVTVSESIRTNELNVNQSTTNFNRNANPNFDRDTNLNMAYENISPEISSLEQLVTPLRLIESTKLPVSKQFPPIYNDPFQIVQTVNAKANRNVPVNAIYNVDYKRNANVNQQIPINVPVSIPSPLPMKIQQDPWNVERSSFNENSNDKYRTNANANSNLNENLNVDWNNERIKVTNPSLKIALTDRNVRQGSNSNYNSNLNYNSNYNANYNRKINEQIPGFVETLKNYNRGWYELWYNSGKDRNDWMEVWNNRKFKRFLEHELRDTPDQISSL